MKTLAQYLAEYIVSTDVERGTQIEGFGAWDRINMRGWIKQGIKAYESTENCTITVTDNPVEKECVGCEFLAGKYCTWIKKKRIGQPPCQQETYACESCSLVKTGVVWREETEQYECGECYESWRKEQGL